MNIADFCSKEFLIELDFYDKSSLIPILRKYKDKWIHFSNGVVHRPSQKYTYPEIDPASKTKNSDYLKKSRAIGNFYQPHLGINYATQWNDPKGIYFYPCSFLLSHNERILNGQQHGINYRYYYICDIDMKNDGIDLEHAHWSSIEVLAKRNGWFDLYKEFREKPIAEQRSILRNIDVEKPGAFLWAFADYLNDHNLFKRDNIYKGLSWVYDPNKSIIHSNEPHQIVVFKPSIIKILYSGENKDKVDRSKSDYTNLGDNTLVEWKTFIINFFKSIRGEVGNGEIIWKKKLPSLTFSVGKANYIISIEIKGIDDIKLILKYNFGRMKGYETISDSLEFEKRSSGELVENVLATINRVSSYKTDLIKDWGKGIFKNKDVEKFSYELIKTKLFSSGGEVLEETEANDSKETDGRNVIFRAYNINEVAYNKCSTMAYISLYRGTSNYEDKETRDLYNLGLVVKLNSGASTIYSESLTYTFGYYSSRALLISEYPDYPKIAQDVAEKMRKDLAIFSPESNKKPNQKCKSLEEYNAFVGYFVLHCGLSIDGELTKLFDEEINSFMYIDNEKDFIYDVRTMLYYSMSRY